MSSLSNLAKNAIGKAGVHRFPYETRSFNLVNFFLDPFTKKKFDERSLIIQVEGNVHSGKQDFGRRLAKNLGMYYIPNVDIEPQFYTSYGYDFRALNNLLPERLRACDFEMFHENPTRHSAIHLFRIVQKMRLYQYVMAIQHLFNTGQGVVMSRSVFTDRVFIEAMHNIGWLPRGYLRGDGARFYDWKTSYNYARNLALADILTPHLTIYLKTPVETCLKRIKSDSDPMIANSKALVPEFLEAIEKAYDNLELRKAEIYGHVLKYDYPERVCDDEIEDIAKDVTSLDYNCNMHDTRFEAWDPQTMPFWYTSQRRMYTSDHVKDSFRKLNSPDWFDIAGLGDSISVPDLKLREVLIENHVNNLGWFNDYDHDTEYNNWFKVFFGKRDFGRDVFKEIKGDGPM